MRLDNGREIVNFRNGCIEDLKSTLVQNYNVHIQEDELEDFINEIGDICYWIHCCNKALHNKQNQVEIEEEEDFISLYE